MLKLQKKVVPIHFIMFMVCALLGIAFSTTHKVSCKQIEKMEYQNPEDIIIATPSDEYKTKASKISILGACDFRYPLYMNGEAIATTEHGFFTQYVELDVGENVFQFENNGKQKVITIIRQKASTGTSNGSTNSNKTKYKAYTQDTYGVVTERYVMPRSTVNSSDLECMPLTRGTTFQILGEYGSYYKIADGSYVAKSSISKYVKKLEINKVTKARIEEKEDTNQVVTLLTMNVNTLYEVYFEGDCIYLTLYHTTSAKKPSVPKNSLIKSVSLTKNTKDQQVTYCFELYSAEDILGYDVLFNSGVMKFELKRGPRLEEQGTLKGTTIFLDAGHGQSDSGALGPLGKYGPMEKDINLSIALYTKEYLENLGATVIMSRSDDTFYSLSERVSMIRNLRPDISVSIHGNSLDYASNYSNASGFLTYYSYMIAGDVPTMINNRIADELSFQAKSTRSKSLSLTRLTTCPSVLLETAFLSNPNDYEYLINGNNQIAFGQAIGKAIQNYLESVKFTESVTYTVQKGDTLSKIANQYDTTVKEIMDNNGITNENYIFIGQVLTIPR